ncbi:MAG TPA: hypothetical protein VL358_04820 [Caulobacteraceae bacterium]|jgi:hypothetical protein|nr:hypothetical protein [Caulobacteraceae bacterium]
MTTDPATQEREQLAALIHAFYTREIGRLMQQAEHWAANGKPLAVHHRLQMADAFYQVAVRFEPSRRARGWPEPFSDIEASLKRPEIKPPGQYPSSASLYRYSDVRFVVAELDRLDMAASGIAVPAELQTQIARDLAYCEGAEAHMDEGPIGNPAAQSLIAMVRKYAALAVKAGGGR